MLPFSFLFLSDTYLRIITSLQARFHFWQGRRPPYLFAKTCPVAAGRDDSGPSTAQVHFGDDCNDPSERVLVG